jgi:hypothetical protein
MPSRRVYTARVLAFHGDYRSRIWLALINATCHAKRSQCRATIRALSTRCDYPHPSDSERRLPGRLPYPLVVAATIRTTAPTSFAERRAFGSRVPATVPRTSLTVSLVSPVISAALRFYATTKCMTEPWRRASATSSPGDGSVQAAVTTLPCARLAPATTRACAISLRCDETGPVACLPLRLSKPCDTVVTIPALAVLRRAGRRTHPGLFRFTAPRRFNPACAEPWRLPDRSRSPAAHGDDSRLRYAVRRDGPSQAYAVPTRLILASRTQCSATTQAGQHHRSRRTDATKRSATRLATQTQGDCPLRHVATRLADPRQRDYPSNAQPCHYPASTSRSAPGGRTIRHEETEPCRPPPHDHEHRPPAVCEL